MFCRKCGNQITGSSKFCPKCGEPVPQAAAQTQTQNNTAQTDAQQPKQYNDYATSQLFDAVKSRSVDQVKQLIANGANVNIIDSDGWTPLMFASYCSLEMAQTLLAAGAIADTKSKVGQTALSLAQANRTNDKNAIIELLQQYKNGNMQLEQGQIKPAGYTEINQVQTTAINTAQAPQQMVTNATVQVAAINTATQQATVSGMYCVKCGTDVAPGVKFCPKCGNPMTQANAPSPEASVTQTENIPAVDSSPIASVAVPSTPVSAEVTTAADATTSDEPSKTSEAQTHSPKAKRTIRLVTPTGEIILATEESIFAGEYVLEVHREDELLGSAKINAE